MKFYDFDEQEKNIPEEIRQRAEAKAQEMYLRLTLSQIREQLGVTQEELAEKLNIKQSSISKMEKREGISLNNLQKMIEAMGGEVEININFPTKNKQFKLKPKFSG